MAIKKHSRKGYIRTLEAILAIVMSFVFISFIIPTKLGGETGTQEDKYLGLVSRQDNFRIAALSAPEGCYKSNSTQQMAVIIGRFIPESIDFYICSSSKPGTIPLDLPSEKVTADSAILSGDENIYNPRIIRLFYWSK